MKAYLKSNKKIWDFAPHNAFPDIIRFQNQWFVCLREASLHSDTEPGMIRILQSHDAINWHAVALLHDKEFDLRDPKFLIHSDGSLMLYVCALSLNSKKRMFSLSCRSLDGRIFSSFFVIAEEGEWLWRIIREEKSFYAASYRFSVPGDRYKPWIASLHSSSDGKFFKKVVDWPFKGRPSEACLYILKDQMTVFIRQDREDRKLLVGTSSYPYKEWHFEKAPFYLACPNGVLTQENKAIIGGRLLQINPYGIFEKTTLFEYENNKWNRMLVLPSFGDSGYPGLVLVGNRLFVCYYSSQLKKSAIYLAEVEIEKG